MYGKEHTIVAHSGCGGYALTLNKLDEIVFKVRCSGPEIPTGYILPLKHWVNVAVTYDEKYVRIYINGVKYNEVFIKMKFSCSHSFDIG